MRVRWTTPATQDLYNIIRHCAPLYFFRHIFLVRSSQTCTTIPEKIPRQCTIENCARLQRRTHFRPQTFHRYLTTYGPGDPPASARQTEEFSAKSNLLNTLPLTILLSST
jgi:hypothetical protein